MGRIVEAGPPGALYEDAFREVVEAGPPGAFGVEVVTGRPWVEIDIPEDLEKAEPEVYFRLQPLPTGPTSRAARPGARP